MTALPSATSTSSTIIASNPPEVNDTGSKNNDILAPRPSVVSDQTSVSQSIPSAPATLSFHYGVDWSDRAGPTSHCWFPITSNDSSTAQSCAFVSCTNMESEFLQCGSCTLIVHLHHLNDSSATAAGFLPPCRPAFVAGENSFLDEKEISVAYDKHFWSHISVLPEYCEHCQQPSTSTSLPGFESVRTSAMSAFNIIEQCTSVMNSMAGNSNSKMAESSSALVCLWCLRGYHQSCWKYLADQTDNMQCDYGMFRNIIVRPQWLRRSIDSPNVFKAQWPSHLNNSDSKSNAFPYTPVLVFINKRSGGQVGEQIYRELLRKLNPRQVFLLENDTTITQAIEIYSSLPNIRICVFGGDGTVGWVLGRLAEAYPSRNNPPVSIYPLGTGNDLSRVLAWGEQYDVKRLFHTLVQIPQAQVVVLDRWEVRLGKVDTPTSTSAVEQNYGSVLQIGRTLQSLFTQPKFVRDTSRVSYQSHQELPNTRFINYMSFGLDAAIALDFHDQRTRDPSKFSSPFKNKLMYLNESRKYLNDFARANLWNLRSFIRLICDGHDLTDTIRDCHTLVILNIPGYAAGTDPWGNALSSSSTASSFSDLMGLLTGTIESDTEQTMSPSRMIESTGLFQQQDFGDRKIEVVALSTAHMAAIHVGFRGNRIAQCNQMRIELLSPMTAQMDGEPFYLPESVAVNIGHAGQVLVLKNENK